MQDLTKSEDKGLIVAGMQSSGGKTAVTSMLLSALRKRNIATQPFKIGPDYIDPGFHFHFSAKQSINLDPWIMGQEHIVKTSQEFTKNSFGVAEGVMGLFDGFDPTSASGSTMEVASWLSWPIILVVPCRNTGRSITAAIKGFVSEAGGIKHFAGIIFNHVNSDSHAKYLRKACASLKIPILGALPEIDELQWSERHLGLQPEIEQILPEADILAELAEKYINLNLFFKNFSLPPLKKKLKTRNFSKYIKRIAVAHDQAFHFYYAANLEWLREQKVEIIPFSPLNDSNVPENVEGIILGGGFPEVFAEKMSANKRMLLSLKKFIESKIPCYAECGGLMLLADGLKVDSGKLFPMAGVVPGTVEMTKQLQNFGYCKINTQKSGEVRGHEFHYSRWSEETTRANLWEVTRHSTGVIRREGYRTSNLHASFVHLYFPQASTFIRKILHLSFFYSPKC